MKGNMAIELAVDAMELAEHIDQMVLFSGDSDFRSLVEAVLRRGVRVTVIPTISSRSPMSCGVRPTFSPTSSSCNRSSDAISPSARSRANLEKSSESNRLYRQRLILMWTIDPVVLCPPWADLGARPSEVRTYPKSRSSGGNFLPIFNFDSGEHSKCWAKWLRPQLGPTFVNEIILLAEVRDAVPAGDHGTRRAANAVA